MTTVKRIIHSPKMEIMPGRSINAPLPDNNGGHLDPFILLHHFGPLEVNYLNKFQFEPHPHKGFEAVSILFEGEMEHRDSSGGHGRLTGGAVQWMTAGSGILHEEKQPQEFLEKGGTLHGIQLWINLPAEFKSAAPKYQDIAAEKIPQVNSNGVTERIIAGNYKGIKGAASTYSPMNVVHAVIPAGKSLLIEINKDFNSGIYITKGKINTGGQFAEISDMVIFENDGEEINVTADEDSEILLLSGKPLNEPVVQYGPFVMNTMGEIKQAFLEYREGKFGNINYNN